MRTIPFTLPSAHVSAPGVTSIPDADVGGYDFMIGGFGFRLATDTQFAYVRGTEPTTTHRFDSSLEPGEQSLSPLPWIKSQSSFHGGAGQLNLEQGFTAFQYQQEQVEHIRFDNSLGVNVWTPGQVSRLPDTSFFNFGFTSTCMITATVGGIDYAIIGGVGNLYQAAWLSGPDSPPTVTAIDLSGSAFGGASNCAITSLATDGTNYYGVLQLTTVGYVAGVLTYVISGAVNSTAAPTALYEVPNQTSGATRHNLCTNPSFETDATGWAGAGTPTPTVARTTSRSHSGAASLLVTSTGSATFLPNASMVVATTVGTTYTISCYVYVPAGQPNVTAFAGSTAGATSTTTNAWQRISATVTATSTSTSFGVIGNFTGTGQTFYIDDVLIEVGAASNPYFDGSTSPGTGYTPSWDGTVNDSSSTAVFTASVIQVPGVVGWQKARLVGCLGNSLYELSPTASPHSALPAPRYTHPLSSWTWSDTAESPDGILAAGYVGSQASILEFTLDNSGGTPFLSGGQNVAKLPQGETVLALADAVGSFLAVATTSGIRVGTYDTYTGGLKLGPISVTTTKPVLDITTRDRFVYGSYTNQQADGKTGLVCIDLTMVIDAAGRLAYAPDLRPPTTAPTGLGNVTGVALLPKSNRLLFVTPEGLHVEGNGPGSDGTAWIRTSRIRWDTAELKLFKLGRVHGTLDLGNIQITGIAPYGVSQNLGTFGFINNADPGEFRLIGGTNEWMQLQFSLIGSGSVLSSYQVKAYPAPQRQHVIQMTANCFVNETDRFGLEVTDPQTPRQRLQNVQDLEQAGNETRLVEFTTLGAVAQLVVIDQIEFQSYSRPSVDDDFGGYITFRLRTTES